VIPEDSVLYLAIRGTLLLLAFVLFVYGCTR
jgi:hypothetical protein